MEILRSFLRRYFAGKPAVASCEVSCPLRLDNLPIVFYLTWLSNSLRKQSRFGDTTTGFPRKWNGGRNSILMTRHYPGLGSACDWLNQISHAVWPIRSTTQVWVVTRHQYGISAVFYRLPPLWASASRYLLTTRVLFYPIWSYWSHLKYKLGQVPKSTSFDRVVASRPGWDLSNYCTVPYIIRAKLYSPGLPFVKGAMDFITREEALSKAWGRLLGRILAYFRKKCIPRGMHQTMRVTWS